jgi:adenine deaminase
LDPVAAIQMATLNVAEHFSLDNLIGGIAPGRYADLVVIPDVRTIEAQLVVSSGQVVAEKGALLTAPRRHTFSKPSMNSIKLPRDVTPADFIISTHPNVSRINARIINMVTDLVTAELETQWPVTDGRINADLDQDVIKIAAIDRTHNPGKTYVGLIKGIGLKSGAVACSAAWDSSTIIVVGTSDADMAGAVNRIRTLQGGAVVCDNKKILAELPLPIFGIMSDLPIETIARRLQKIRTTVSDLGMSFPDPLLTLITLTGAAIPYLRICEEGLVNLKDGKTVKLIIS